MNKCFRCVLLLLIPFGLVSCSGPAPADPRYDPEKVDRIRNEVLGEGDVEQVAEDEGDGE